jgi:hypothetical protein
MGFKAERFQAAEYSSRTERVEVSALAEFFDDGEAPVFVVRGLTAVELQRAIESGLRRSPVDNIVKAIASQKEQVDTIRKALGLSDDVPGEMARRLEMLVLGSVEPKLDHASVVKIAEVCPIEFFDMTNKITALTGQGGSRVKPQPSSQMTTD